MSTTSVTGAASARFDWRRLIGFWPIVVGLLCMYIPSYLEVAEELWPSEDHKHGAFVLIIALFLFWLKRDELAAITPKPAPVLGWTLIVIGALFYILGRSQDIYMFDLGSQIPIFLGVLLAFGGWPAIRVMWFPVLFFVFLVPLPGPLVTAMTSPLKAYVSQLAEFILYHAGYPIGRSGVVLQVGQYQLMVADACSGLNSMFSLSAMGLLYVYLMRHESILRNVLLLASILPFAFLANVIRVLALILVTYHFGDEAAQGTIHPVIGLVLYAAALILLFAWDALLGLFFRKGRQ